MKVVKAKLIHGSHSKLDLGFIEIGDVLVFDIWIKKDDEYFIIIKAGTKLSEKLYLELEKQKNLYVSAVDTYKEELTANTLYGYIKYNKDDFEKTLHLLYKINHKLFSDYLSSEEDMIDIKSIDEIIKSIIYLVQSDSEYLKKTIPYFNDAYKLEIHSLHVAIYSVSLGSHLNYDEKELLQLGTAGLLHDIGVKYINDEIKNKDSKLNLEELETMHQHAKYSNNIARKNHILNPYILEAIMHHHEAPDGSGYPEHLRSKRISPFGAILSICDNFDALTNNRPYRDKYSTFEALKKMMKEKEMVKKFNQDYLRVFLESLLA